MSPVITEESGLPVVSVWEEESGGYEWRGDIGAYETLNVQPKFNDAGTWSLTGAVSEQSDLFQNDRLVLIEWRDKHIMTGRITPNAQATEEGVWKYNVSGIDVLSTFDVICYPDPTETFSSQPDHGVYTGPAETVIRSLVRDHYATRYGAVVTVNASLGRGDTVTARTKWQPLLGLLQAKARGLGFRLYLDRSTGTRATLRFSVYEPTDLSGYIVFDEASGSLTDVSFSETAPTCTCAIVGGAGLGVDRIVRRKTTPDSEASALEWGGHREQFIDGPDSFDNTELDQAGEEAITAGQATTNLTVTVAESQGLQAFTHYTVGDTCKATLVNGVDLTETITAIAVTVDDSGPKVTPSFGDPDADEPNLGTAQLIRLLRRRVAALEQRR